MAATIITDPTGERYGFPTYAWGQAPAHLMTRRMLGKAGLRKNRQDPVAQMLRPRRNGRPPLLAYLYDSTKAAKRRPWTPAKQAAVQKAADARKVCGQCGATLDYVPHKFTCNDCHDLTTRPAPAPEERAA